MVDYKILEENLNEALNKETKESWDKFLDENKGELQKGLNTAVSWGIEAYSIDKETGKLRTLTLEEALELKDNPNYEVISIKDTSPEEVMKQFSEHLTSNELEYLVKPVLNIPSGVKWNEKTWLEYSKPSRLEVVSSDDAFRYEEHEEVYEEFCKHQGHLYNQGIIFCKAEHDPSKCEECSFREPIKHICKVSSVTYSPKATQDSSDENK